jgi:leucyl aminopeptidase (aminopeptidase T)
MRTACIIFTSGLLAACGTGSAASPRASSVRHDSTAVPAPDFSALAHRVVNTSLGIQLGDVVVVDGGKHTIPLMEEMAIEAEKAGGMPNLWLESDRVARAMLTEVKDSALDQKPTYLADWYGHTTVWIGLGNFENDKAVFADVPEAKLARLSASGQEIVGMLNASPIRGAFIDYPTTGRAAEVGLPYDRFAKMQWAAIGTDYGRIAAAAAVLKHKLGAAKEVHITAPGGTDLRFSLAGRPIVVNAGIVSRGPVKEKLLLNRFVTLPGGTISLAPRETSVSGTLVVARDRCKFGPLTNARYQFNDGTLASAKADEGDACLQENLRVYGAPMHRLGGFALGLNPALEVVEEGGDYRPRAAAGLVTLTLGDNQFLGGANTVPGGIAIDIRMTHATVELDGEKIIEDGKLGEHPTAQAAR